VCLTHLQEALLTAKYNEVDEMPPPNSSINNLVEMALLSIL
jgi:hypothetical protein